MRNIGGNMSFKLKATEICPRRNDCQYAENCQGAAMRSHTFVCDFVKEDGTIMEGKFRDPNDQTGKMKILVEQ